MIIKTIQVGMIGTNCYVVACPETKEAVVIDPGDEAKKILNLIQKNDLKAIAIINTHGHWDHVGANNELKELIKVPVLIHEQDAQYLTDGKLNLGSLMGHETASPAADKLLKEGDLIQFGKVSLKVIHTPGHTPGGISLIGEKVAFVGDTLFARSIGRTDLPGGNFATLIASIKDKLLLLDDDFVAYPGHGPSTTIGKERNENPFLLED
ncbi:MBL fold metallo-hydrolase [Candidatus Formimonas warabiya]|uniref:MBL fold metallo-hydrolase n=1 Tax=Formimonas warabiya TaxID=1761012 RepID=A0A3G1KPB4_FORW1|nr:MBL fold metallo-hydrolase [Candidatus Formimonas warabiya]ATW23965.1 MBL fold metallo-hydrolase [Candidatus Formimonas warabiya]